MFIVHSTSPIDGEWEQRDIEIIEAAGVSPNYSSTDSGTGKKALREHGWITSTFEEAIKMRKRLESVPFVLAFIREK